MKELPDIPDILLHRYQNSRRHGRSKILGDEVFDLFQDVVSALPSVFLIFDALDECTDVSYTVSWLKDAVKSLPRLRVLGFSRDTAEVRRRLEHLPSIRMGTASIEQDVDRYLISVILTLPRVDLYLSHRVLETLSQKADGIFLFAALSINTLRSVIDLEDMVGTMNSIPSGLAKVYELILKRLSRESCTRQALAQRVFRSMCVSTRPLKWPEMRHALSWDPGLQKFQKRKEPFQDTIFELCCPLIEYQAETDTVLLTHFSFYEYIRRTLKSTSA